ncbi:uncharacterized protein TrAtP1_012261 [Trichoderma atroviride]|uniref:uncharacterized protein n=1 Tax=Hypocrea atroviridis TaxID=63577 RepID=UPI0033285A6F|nr:hypothetical protein TrAtP1_012261 [Trichoderma atroviride]
MFGEKALCRAIDERASTSIVSASPSISSSTTQAQPQITSCGPASTITTTVTTTVTATAPARGKETITQSPIPQPTSGNTTAQIIGIAIGSSTIVGVVAAFFFFAGHHSSRRRPSTHDNNPNLESFRKKLDKRWKKKFSRNARSEHNGSNPAELEAAAEVRQVSMPPIRPIHGTPTILNFNLPSASSLARGVDIIRNPPSPPPTAVLQPLRVEIPPVELPTFDDPGTSPLPEYEELDAARRHPTFSWGAPEATYRPDKFPSTI